MRTSDPNDFSRMVKGLRELDGGEKEQRQVLQWDLGGQAEKPKCAEIGGGESWGHSTTTHKSFLSSLWIPDRVHSGGASNECGQDWAPVLSRTLTSHQALEPSEEDAKPIHQKYQFKVQGLVKSQALSSNHLSSGKEFSLSDQKTA